MNDDLNGDISINLKKVSQIKDYKNVTRILAMDLQENPYLVVGDYFKNLPDSSLKELRELSGNLRGEDENDPAAEEMLLLVIMLSKAEGIEADAETLGNYVGMLRLFIAGTFLHRCGVVKTHFQNFSFDCDPKAVMFEKL